MELDVDNKDGLTVVTVRDDRIDAAVAIQFKDRMRVLSNDGPDRIVLNLSNVQFIDSSGLGAIVAAMKHQRDGQTLELAALSPTVDKVFRMTRMDSIFAIHDDVGAAQG